MAVGQRSDKLRPRAVTAPASGHGVRDAGGRPRTAARARGRGPRRANAGRRERRESARTRRNRVLLGAVPAGTQPTAAKRGSNSRTTGRRVGRSRWWAARIARPRPASPTGRRAPALRGPAPASLRPGASFVACGWPAAAARAYPSRGGRWCCGGSVPAAAIPAPPLCRQCQSFGSCRRSGPAGLRGPVDRFGIDILG